MRQSGARFGLIVAQGAFHQSQTMFLIGQNETGQQRQFVRHRPVGHFDLTDHVGAGRIVRLRSVSTGLPQFKNVGKRQQRNRRRVRLCCDLGIGSDDGSSDLRFILMQFLVQRDQAQVVRWQRVIYGFQQRPMLSGHRRSHFQSACAGSTCFFAACKEGWQKKLRQTTKCNERADEQIHAFLCGRRRRVTWTNWTDDGLTGQRFLSTFVFHCHLIKRTLCTDLSLKCQFALVRTDNTCCFKWTPSCDTCRLLATLSKNDDNPIELRSIVGVVRCSKPIPQIEQIEIKAQRKKNEINVGATFSMLDLNTSGQHAIRNL